MLNTRDAGFLHAALVGYQRQAATIQEQIDDIVRRLGRRRARAPQDAAAPAHEAPQRTKHRISPEGRKRIAEAQRRRWAAAQQKAGKKTASAGAEK